MSAPKDPIKYQEWIRKRSEATKKWWNDPNNQEKIKIRNQKISETKKGKKRPPFSEEWRKHLSESHKKNPVRYWLGKKFTEEHKKNISKALKGKPKSEEWKRKKSEVQKGKKHPKRGGYHFSEETKEKLRIVRLKQKFPIVDTSIERKFKVYLDERKINYIHPFNLGNKFQCDFYLPEFNLIVECDGTYWHSRPDMKLRDKRKDAYAKKCGFNIIRLSEEEINKGQFPSKLQDFVKI